MSEAQNSSYLFFILSRKRIKLMHLSALIGTYRHLTELIGILRLGAIVDLQSKITGLIWPYLDTSGHNWTVGYGGVVDLRGEKKFIS